MNRQLYEKKKKLQKTRNILKNISGVEIHSIKEISSDGLVDKDVYRNKIIPDSKICFTEDISIIVNWIENNTPFQEGDDFGFIVNCCYVNAKIVDIKEAFSSIWMAEEYEGVLFLSNDLKTMYEFGSDSRDEYHYLFDKYDLK
ncbi:hypothetical protein [Eubacterium sp.]|uniref:hypothetical protein n=1 Tax=Eubacterium sp. TaxID=142586 RepID=UPI0025D992FC|nr:hypothetical protein [Eubacterium sp.]MCR5628864.1 hypothetical protein [Eubacterium sp.]